MVGGPRPAANQKAAHSLPLPMRQARWVPFWRVLTIQPGMHHLIHLLKRKWMLCAAEGFFEYLHWTVWF